MREWLDKNKSARVVNNLASIPFSAWAVFPFFHFSTNENRECFWRRDIKLQIVLSLSPINYCYTTVTLISPFWIYPGPSCLATHPQRLLNRGPHVGYPSFVIDTAIVSFPNKSNPRNSNVTTATKITVSTKQVVMYPRRAKLQQRNSNHNASPKLTFRASSFAFFRGKKDVALYSIDS